MTTSETLVTVASWEERFRKGLEGWLVRHNRRGGPKTVVMFYFDGRYAKWSSENRGLWRHRCEELKINFVEPELKVDDFVANWTVMSRELGLHVGTGDDVMVDMTTMPRETILSSLWLIEALGGKVSYTYRRPASYGDWLSKDPERPRFLFKMSGETRLGLRTALVVLAGYDVQRTIQLRRFFEPEITVIGLQRTPGDSENDAEMKKHRDHFQNDSSIRFFDLDAYGEDCGQRAIERAIRGLRRSHNVVMSSLGPKLSAVALYRLQKRSPMIGLVYAPSREFNREYSEGVGQEYSGSL